MTQDLTAPAVDDTFAVPAGEARLGRVAAALRERGHAVHLVDDPASARDLVPRLIPAGETVFTATSETLRQSGIAADLDATEHSVRGNAAGADGDVHASIRLGALPDVVVGSVHAVTENGLLVAASASGSQLAPYASGAKRAIWVVGAQKVVPDLDAALRRIHTYSLPKEWRRLQRYGQSSFVGKILIVEREALPDRGTVVLIRRPIGF